MGKLEDTEEGKGTFSTTLNTEHRKILPSKFWKSSMYLSDTMTPLSKKKLTFWDINVKNLYIQIFFPENNQVCFKCVYGNIIEIHYRNNRTNSLKPGNNLKKLILWLSFEHLYQISLKVKCWPLKNINSFSREIRGLGSLNWKEGVKRN